MTYLEAFNNCLSGPWTTTGLDVQWKEDNGNRLFFLCTSRKEDWTYNFDFAIQPYKKMPFPWYAHRGFVSLWNSCKDEILKAFSYSPPTLIAGYSQGAAIATLAHEAFYFESGLFPRTLAFASPRVIWTSYGIDPRFEGLHNIYVRGDLVHHVPPVLFGYRHVGEIEPVGNHFPIWHSRHEPSCYRKYL